MVGAANFFICKYKIHVTDRCWWLSRTKITKKHHSPCLLWQSPMLQPQITHAVQQLVTHTPNGSMCSRTYQQNNVLCTLTTFSQLDGWWNLKYSIVFCLHCKVQIVFFFLAIKVFFSPLYRRKFIEQKCTSD